MNKLKDHFNNAISKQVDVTKRVIAVDFLRVISLISIFMLHSSPSAAFNALLQFCVPAMVFLSGICYHGRITDIKSYFSYVKKRFFKIALPTSFFALAFGLFVDLFCLFTKRSILFSMADILTGIILYKGIGYVWIMRIFFFIALLIPVAQKINSINNDFLFIGCCLVLYFIYKAALMLILPDTFVYEVFYYLFFETIPYFLIWMIGMRYSKMKIVGKVIVLVLCAAGLVFGLVMNNGNVQIIKETKYPPESAYIAYGLILTVVFYEVLKIITGRSVKPNLFNGIVCFISQKSNEIYLAHIPFVYFIFMIEMSRSLPFFFKFFFIFFASIVSVAIIQFVSGKIKTVKSRL